MSEKNGQSNKGKDGGSVLRGVTQEDSTMIARRQASARFLGTDPCPHNGDAEVGCHRHTAMWSEHGDILKRSAATDIQLQTSTVVCYVVTSMETY